MTLLFGDEFNGPAGSLPNQTLWHAKHMGGQAQADWGGFTNIKLDGNSNVIITATKQSSGRWLSGWLTGAVGYHGPRHVEARALVAEGLGTWSSPIWEWAYPYGAGGIEVDVIERLGRQPKAYNTTVHNWSVSPQKAKGKQDNQSVDLGLAFHVYAADIHATHIDFFLDGVLQFTVHNTDVGVKDFTVYQTCANSSLNMGGWGGTIDPSLKQVHLTVDYIHVSSLAA